MSLLALNVNVKYSNIKQQYQASAWFAILLMLLFMTTYAVIPISYEKVFGLNED